MAPDPGNRPPGRGWLWRDGEWVWIGVAPAGKAGSAPPPASGMATSWDDPVLDGKRG
jgi:hypothetical protein